MNPLESYLHNLSLIRSSGAAVKETSYYGTLDNLFNEIGKTLKPKVRSIINIAYKGAGLPDGGFFTPDQFQKRSKDVVAVSECHGSGYHTRSAQGTKWGAPIL